LVEREFSSARIGREVVDLYRRLLEEGAAAAVRTTQLTTASSGQD
jgi:hypothetical protein